MEKFLVFIAVVIVAGVFTLIGCVIGRDVHLSNQYSRGEITLAEFCDRETNNGTDNDVPVICYNYYNVHQVGTRTKMVGKMMEHVPILESNQ